MAWQRNTPLTTSTTKIQNQLLARPGPLVRRTVMHFLSPFTCLTNCSLSPPGVYFIVKLLHYRSWLAEKHAADKVHEKETKSAARQARTPGTSHCHFLNPFTCLKNCSLSPLLLHRETTRLSVLRKSIKLRSWLVERKGHENAGHIH
jgi:hypothetical protein